MLSTVAAVEAAYLQTLALVLPLGPSCPTLLLDLLLAALLGPYWPIHAQNRLMLFVGCLIAAVLALFLLRVHLYCAAA